MKTQTRRVPWIRNRIAAGLIAGASVLAMGTPAMAAQYAANFKGTDIQEFINIVGKNLQKTIIVDPTVRGKINVRSYDLLNDDQYYQFFLSVLDVYGYAVVEMDGNIIKVVKGKDAKNKNIRVADDRLPGDGDEMVTRIVPLYNVEAKQLAPLLRQLNDNSDGGNVVNYDPSNVLMITGRAATVNKLVEIVKRVDLQGDTKVQVVKLQYASAAEMVRIIDALYRSGAQQSMAAGAVPKVVADERTNSVVISGDEKARKRAVQLVHSLDQDMRNAGNTRVFYLKYAQAEELQEVLSGFAESLEQAEDAAKGASRGMQGQGITIMAHADSNALVINAKPDQMQEIESVIRQLDIRRAQVLVEAIIVEIAEGDDISFGVQMYHESGALTQFNNGTGVTIGEIAAGLWDARETPGSVIIDANGNRTENPDTPGNISTLAAALAKVNGMAWGVQMGDFGALLQAVASDSNSNVLATPSITTLDNQEASFIVGDEVPVITGSAASSGNDNPFQTVERKEVGIKLTVKPQINEGDAVQMEIVQETSNVNGRTSVDVTFGKRELKTTVLADSGETIVLGGLLNEDVQESVSKIPLLGDIPYLGALFTSTSSKKTKRNLMIFIKPTIIRDGVTMNGLSGRKYNYIRAAQLAQEEEGVALMPNTSVPVLPEWNQPGSLTPEAQQILENYQKGNDMETPIRDDSSWMNDQMERLKKDKTNGIPPVKE
ncbi:type II secretion system protein GspD [Ferrimonas sediminicola]|uniref:Type II secretion system protein GspD n=1 Tax=Ferrimonas sediminicola TaxID=2569538 RepID=A0A4U1BBU6_9GAMM|nr:type II secretion system secretin GspD [Ferrimonas sediminicola]TKB47640.1 type II secretion system protein GspD [Ferrimonas sediminicola]